jgi:hypothetical protein
VESRKGTFSFFIKMTNIEEEGSREHVVIYKRHFSVWKPAFGGSICITARRFDYYCYY